MGKTIAKFLCFGSFAGAWARHEGRKPANSKELFIGTVIVTNFDHMLDSSYL